MTDDNTINNTEAHQDHTTITGHVTGDVHEGDQVDLTVNGQHYIGSVDDKGRYSIAVSTDDLISGGDKPNIHAVVTGTDTAGNTVLAEGDRVVNIDTRADAHITDTNLALNGDRESYTLSGHVTGDDVHIGDPVKVHYMGQVLTTTVKMLPDGHLGYNSDDLVDATGKKTTLWTSSTLKDIEVQVTSTDPHGNSITASTVVHPHSSGDGTSNNNGGTTTTTPPVHIDPPHANITISPVAGNDVINQAESKNGTTTIRGTVSGDVQAGDHVILHIGGQDIPVEITARPNLPDELGYKIDVDTKLLLAHPDISASVTAHNGAGTLEFAANKHVGVDTDVKAAIHLDPIAGDDVINITEAKSGTTNVSGTVSGDGIHAGSNVTIMVNGHPVTTQVFEDPKTHELKFSKEVSINDLRQDPHITVSVTGRDDQGNVTTVSDDRHITVDLQVGASVTIDSVTPDNVLNLTETQQGKTHITGHATGDVQPGDTVTVKVNGQDYPNVKLDNNLDYQVDVNTSDLLKGSHNTVTAAVTGHDDHGNTVTHTETHHYSIDTTAGGSVTINVVSGDNMLSAKDLEAGTTEVSGTVGGDVHEGDVITITVNGHDVPNVKVIQLPNMNGALGYIAHVDTADLKADPNVHVSIAGKDAAGNTFVTHADQTLIIDDHADVTLHINDVTPDNVLNLAESGQATTAITGTVTGDVKEGDKVLITVNGNELPASLHSDGHGGFTFTLNASTADLLQNPNITYKVTGTDDLGNTVTVSESNTVVIDQEATNAIHIDTIAGDNRVNIVESQQPTTTLHGTIDGDAHPGDTVTIIVNGQAVPGGVVIDSNGVLSYEIPVANSLLKEGDNVVEVSVTGQDAPGNTATSHATQHFTLDTQISSSITIDPVATDNVISAKESAHISVSGQVGGDAQDGDHVTLSVHGHSIDTKVVMINGHLGYEVKVDKEWLKEGDNNIKVSVKVSDDAGNVQTADSNQHVVLDTHADATITLNPVAGNDVVNAAETKHLTVSGLVDGDAKEGDKVTLEINGHSVKTDVQNINGHLGYEVHLNKAWLNEGTNDVTVSVDVTDGPQNHVTATQTHSIFVDTKIDASIAIDPVNNNHVINAKAPDHITVTGVVGDDVKLGDHVSLDVNHHTFDATVEMINGQLGYTADLHKDWLNDGDNTLSVRVTTQDDAGNTKSAYSSQHIAVDTHADAVITLNPIAGDDVVNAAESNQITVTGEVTGDAKLNDVVTLLVNNHSTTASVEMINGHLGYKVQLDKAWLNEGDNDVKVSVDVTDGAQNQFTATETHTIFVDTKIDASIAINPVGNNHVINAQTSDHITVTGVVGDDVKLGDHVSLDVNHHTFDATVEMINGQLGYTADLHKDWLNDGDNTLNVSVTTKDDVGNTQTAQSSQHIQLDTHADATFAVDKITGDNHIDTREAHHHLTHITGQVGGDVQDGDTVTAIVNGKHYDALIHTDNGQLTYDIPVETKDLHVGRNNVNVTVTAHDDHGNTNEVHSQKVELTVDAPAHHGHQQDVADKSHHAANDHGLSNLFDDSNDSLSFNLHHDAKDQHGADSHKVFTGKGESDNGKIDLSDLAHELHESCDITHFIKGDATHGKVDASNTAAHTPTAAHPGDAPSTPLSHDSHGVTTYSLDHLIAKPEHYHS